MLRLLGQTTVLTLSSMKVLMEALGLLWKFLSLGVKAILASRMFPSVTTESTLTGSNSNSSYRVQ